MAPPSACGGRFRIRAACADCKGVAANRWLTQDRKSGTTSLASGAFPSGRALRGNGEKVMKYHLLCIIAAAMCAATPSAAGIGRPDSAPAAVPGHGLMPVRLAESTETEPDGLPYCYCSHDDPMCDPETLLA